jgi:transcriptional regulator with XRE-family HTH domain
MVDTSPKGLGKRIRKRREKLGLSQLKLSTILSVPQQTIGGWETGKAKRPRYLFEAAKALCTTEEWLLREQGPEEVIPMTPREQITATIDSLDPMLVPAALEFLRNLGEKESEVA